MVRSNVETDAHDGSEELNRFQLERADLKRQEVQVLGLVDYRADWPADVSRGECLATCPGEDSLDELGGGGFTISAGDRHTKAEGLLKPEFKFADDRYAPLGDLLE